VTLAATQTPRAVSSGTPRPVKEIARGGTGKVELAFRRDARFRRMYAVKRLLGNLRHDPEARAAFLREARVSGTLRHPNIVSVLDVGTDERGPFIVMDFVFGLSLRDLSRLLLDRGIRLPQQLALRIGVSIGHALWAAHDLTDESDTPVGVIHRDITPSNVLVGFDGVVRLVDFGLARGVMDGQSTDLLRGTSGYLSPEQLRFEPVDARSDLFSFGVVLHELLSGERLYGDDVRRAARRTLMEPPPDLRALAPETPEGVLELVSALLAKNPADRPNAAAEVVRILEDEIRGLVITEGPMDLLGFLEEHVGDEIARRRGALAALWDRFETEQDQPAPPRTDSLPPPSAVSTAKLPRVVASEPPPQWRTTNWWLVGGLAAAAAAALVAVFFVTRTPDAPEPPSMQSSAPAGDPAPMEATVEPEQPPVVEVEDALAIDVTPAPDDDDPDTTETAEMTTTTMRRRPRMRPRPRGMRGASVGGMKLWMW